MCRFMIALHLVIWYAVYNVRVSAVLVHLVSTAMYVVFAPVVLNFGLCWFMCFASADTGWRFYVSDLGSRAGVSLCICT